MSTISRPVLIMAGGTGGHVFPALACAQEFQARGITVHWLGTRRGLEARVIPAAGLPIHYVSIGGLRGKNIFTLLAAPIKLLWALIQAMRIIHRLKPRAVLGMGGFVTGPGGIAAWLLGVPIFIHEQNALPGFTNRLLARLARRVMQGFAGTFPPPALTTGNPIRADIAALTDSRYTSHTPLRILVTGGSLGAQALNQIVPAALAKLKHPLRVRHQSGRGKLEDLRRSYAKHQVTGELSEFIDDMATVYAWADLVICRAGALSLSELTLAGRPALLVPYPFAVDDHQTANALFLVNAGAAVLLPQVQGTHTPANTPLLSSESLATWLELFSAEPARLQTMAEAAHACALPDAAQKVVETMIGDGNWGGENL